jgi:hypothetical protein
MVNDFIPEKFVRRAQEKGYGTLVQELADNLVFSTTSDIIQRVKKSSSDQINPSNETSWNKEMKDILSIMQQESLFTKRFLDVFSI